MSGSFRERCTAARGYAAVAALVALLAWPVLRVAPVHPVPALPGLVAAAAQVADHAHHGVGRGRARPDAAQQLSTPSTTFVADGAATAPVLAPLGAAPALSVAAPRTVGVRLAPVRAPPGRTGC
jgi:hypothetical protein